MEQNNEFCGPITQVEQSSAYGVHLPLGTLLPFPYALNKF